MAVSKLRLAISFVQMSYFQMKTWNHSRKNETVAVDPFGVLGVEFHEVVEENMRSRCHSHWSARMTRVCVESGVDRKGADRVDRKLVNF